MDLSKIDPEDLFVTADTRLKFTFPDITDEYLMRIFKNENLTTEDEAGIDSLYLTKMPMSQALRNRIESLFAGEGGYAAFVEVLRKIMNLPPPG